MIRYLIFIASLNVSYAAAQPGLNFSALKTQLDNQAPKILQKHGAPGVAIAFVQGDDVVGFTAYGFADVATQKPITKDTLFNVGSISKVVTTWGVMQLVVEGKVELDKPINQYLKRWKIPDSEFGVEKVTLRNVLSHTSGLSLGPYRGWNSAAQVPSSIVDSLQGNNNGAGLVKLLHAPDSKWSYSGGGYSVVQLLIEDVSGLSFENYMQQSVLKPLAMNHSTFKVTPKVMEQSATPYTDSGDITSMVYFVEHAAAGLHTTAMDLARFNLAILKNEQGEYNGAQLLPKALIADMTTPANTGGRWSMSYVVDQSNASLGFAGFNRGWVSLSRSMTAQNIGYVILTNSSIGQITNDLDSFILSKVAESQAN